MVTEARCSGCGQVRHAHHFSVDRSRKNGLQTSCKECKKAWCSAVRREVYHAYGGRCQCPHCDVTAIEFLSLDHIHGDGAECRRNGEPRGFGLWLHVKNLGFPKDRFQLLCFNCNCGRGRGECPHVTKYRASLAEQKQQLPLF